MFKDSVLPAFSVLLSKYVIVPKIVPFRTHFTLLVIALAFFLYI
jgi:hypothetical protein